MKNISRIVLAFVFSMGLTLCAAEERPNIVVFLCDDLGYGDLACYGNKTIQTPNVDRLAAAGIRFTDFYSTAPVCSSSRAGFLTGRIPSRIGVYDWIPANHDMHLLPSETTFAAVLQKAGYDTMQSGKWHCNGKFNSREQPQPGDQGFDHWFATQNNAAPSHRNPTNFVRNGAEAGPLEGFSCQLVVGEAIDWLEQRSDKSRPFCLFIAFHEPHEPVASPPELVEKYKVAGAVKPGEAEYYANVENMDAAVGRLVDYLKRNGLWNNTLTLFSSDNGPETLDRYRGAERSHGSPGELRGMKLWMYEAGFRVAGIISWPDKIKPGQVSNVPVGAIDCFQTFCAVAKADLPADRIYDGANLLPLFEDGKFDRAKPLFWYYLNALGAPRVALRDGDWKLVATLEGNLRPRGVGAHSAEWFAKLKTTNLDRFELYNLAADLQENRDLASTEPERLNDLKRKMEVLFREIQHGAPLWAK